MYHWIVALCSNSGKIDSTFIIFSIISEISFYFSIAHHACATKIICARIAISTSELIITECYVIECNRIWNKGQRTKGLISNDAGKSNFKGFYLVWDPTLWFYF